MKKLIHPRSAPVGTPAPPFFGLRASCRWLTVAASALLAVQMACGPRPASATPPATLIDLGGLPNATVYSEAAGLNSVGQVVGRANTSGGTFDAFRWTVSGGMTDLGALVEGWGSEAFGVNDAGQVAGWGPNADNLWHAIVWDPSGALQDVGALIGSWGNSKAYGINTLGQVVGFGMFTYNSNESRAFVWSAGGGVEVLPTLGGYQAEGRAINDVGQVVGWSRTAANISRAFVWSAGQGIRDLGTLGGTESYAYGINAAGQVAGWARPAGSSFVHACIWNASGAISDLGTLGGFNSYAYGINSAGQVVGYSQITGGLSHAFVWDVNHGMQDLGTLGGAQSRAAAINDNGEIVGWANASDGLPHAFIARLSTADTEPPQITRVTVSPETIWPPNGELVGVTVSIEASDNVGIASSKIISITSNEPGPGQTVITGDFTGNVAADRNGSGSGRTYTLTIQCADAAGNISTGTANVVVPHDQRAR